MSAASTPYQAYTGELTAGVNSQEQSGIDAANKLQGVTDGYLNSATGLAQASTSAVNPTGLDAASIQKYMNPYQQSVIDSTLATMNNQNAQQAEQLNSGLISSGSFGGDRAGVAQAALAGQQDLAKNSTIASLNSQNYDQALAAAQQQQGVGLSADQANRAALSSGAELYGNLGTMADSTGLANANAQLSGGVLQQQTQQASDTAKYQQFEEQQAYPFQVAQFLAGNTSALAPLLGSTTSGTSQSSPPNPLNSILGAGLGIGSFFLPSATKTSAAGGRVVDLEEVRRARGGRTIGDEDDFTGVAAANLKHLRDLAPMRRFADGGMASLPYSDAPSYVPAVSLQPARMPQSAAPQAAQPQSTAMDPGTANLMAGAKMFGGSWSAGNKSTNAAADLAQDQAEGWAKGGRVGVLQAARSFDDRIGLGSAALPRRYDDGGVVPAADPTSLLFDPNALGTKGLDALGGPPTGLARAALPLTVTPQPQPSPPASPPPPAGLGGPPTGVAQAALPQPPVPVAPAPNVTPVVGYQNADGSPAPAPGVLAASTGSLPTSGVAAAALPASPPDASSAIDNATAPRSVRNNNPGNIEDGRYAQGLPGYAGSDGRFAKFETPEAGAAAQDNLLASYGRQGLTTPLQIVSKWAPAGDGNNNPTAYAGTVAKQMGIGINDPIDMSDPTQRAALGKAMASVEAGTGSGGGAPSSALAYSGGAGGLTRGLGGPPTGVAQADLSLPQNSGILGKVGLGDLGSILPHVSDDQRLAILSAGLGMAASSSRSVGQAFGEGGLKGVGALQTAQKISTERSLAQAKIANYAAETADKPLARAQGAQEIQLRAQQLHADLERIRQEGQNFQSEDTFRKGSIANETAKIQAERYEVLPGPDGSVRVLDKQNPQRGLLTADQVPAGVGGSSPPAGGASPSAGASSSQAPAGVGSAAPAAGGVPSPSGSIPRSPASSASPGAMPPASGVSPSSASPSAARPSGQPMQLDSSNFVKTGNPTLRAPDGYMPPNYWQNQLRARTDPVVRDTLAKQSVDDVADANKRATKAYSGLFYSDEMDKAIAGLPQTGALAPGGFFNERLTVAKNWNNFVSAIPTLSDMQADPKAVALGESLVKDKTRLAADLTQSLGSREAAQVYSSMMSAVPGGDNSRAGYKAVSSAIRTLSQREIDHNAFLQDWSSRYGNSNGAEVAFNSLNPPMQYARQAEALARIPQQATDLLRANSNDPRIISGFEAKYGAGTSRYFTGKLGQ